MEKIYMCPGGQAQPARLGWRETTDRANERTRGQIEEFSARRHQGE